MEAPQDKSAVNFLSLSQYIPSESTEKDNPKGWIDYGTQNDYPLQLLRLYNNSPIHNALTNSIAFMISGKGTNSILDNAIDGISLDLKLQGQFVAEVIWALDGMTIAKINHLPFDQCRLAYEKETDEITGIWYSKDWANYRKEKNTPCYIPFADPKCAAEYPRQCVYSHVMKTGSTQYAKPDYIGAMNYIELSYQMGLYHVNNILNGLFPSFIINFLNGVPDRQGRESMKREWEEMLSGANNSGKFIMTWDEDPTRVPQITPFPLTDADKQYQFLSEETSKQIMIGHRVTSPLLFGIRDSGGLGSNKDEMIVAMQIFNSQVIQPYQRIIVNAFSGLISNLAIIPNTPLIQDTTAPAQIAAKRVETFEKKNGDAPEFSSECQHNWLSRLEAKAEYIDSEDWELVSETEVTDPHNEEFAVREYMNTLPSRSYADPDPRSSTDIGLYKVRYAYSQNVSTQSRDFCKEMVRWSSGGALFRYEDIIEMGDDGVNSDFAPTGENSYSIWEWKGGVYCHHFWKRMVYMRKRKNGKFLPNDGMTNEVEVEGKVPSTIRKQGKESIAPINTPSRGSLKN
jgi:hypothetical protein